MSQYYHILHGTQRTFVPELAIYITCTILEQGCRIWWMQTESAQASTRSKWDL